MILIKHQISIKQKIYCFYQTCLHMRRTWLRPTKPNVHWGLGLIYLWYWCINCPTIAVWDSCTHEEVPSAMEEGLFQQDLYPLGMATSLSCLEIFSLAPYLHTHQVKWPQLIYRRRLLLLMRLVLTNTCCSIQHLGITALKILTQKSIYLKFLFVLFEKERDKRAQVHISDGEV